MRPETDGRHRRPAPGDKVRYEVLEGDAITEAEALQGRRYVETGYIDALPLVGEMRDRWTDVSTYIGARSAAGDLVGVARLIPYTHDAGLPCVNDFELHDEAVDVLRATGGDRLAEVSGLAVEPAFDIGLNVSRGLYRAMVQYSLVVSGRVMWCAALASRVRRLLARVLDLAMVPMAEPSYYRGAMTEPVLIDVVAQMRHYSLHVPASADYFLQGLELDLDRGRAEVGDAALVVPVALSAPG